MSLDKIKEKCAVCSAYLFPEDDVVYCPECGAPHHRDCYNFLGHCGLKEYHGTENQYQKPVAEESEQEPISQDTVTCSMCGEKYDNNEMACPVCNTPNFEKTNMGFDPFAFAGGVADDTDLGDGITAKDAKKFVGTNAHRYIPKFLNFKNGKKASWNWLGFLMPCGWLLSRKMYLLGIIIGAVQIAIAMLSVPFTAEINQFDFSSVKNYMDYSSIIMENIDMISKTAIVVALAGTLADLLLRIIIGVFGDLIYKNHVVASISEIKKQDESSIMDYRKKGGTSVILGFLGFYLVRELPSIAAYLLGLL